VVYRQQDKTRRLRLAELRRRLATECGLEAFKLPTLLKIVSSANEIPVSEAGKPIKDKIRELYFSEAAVEDGDVEVWTLEMEESEIGSRPFDWDGLQC
jgi:non-ribosomal peptide synthetase component E (peptide arylation enzyme)